MDYNDNEAGGNVDMAKASMTWEVGGIYCLKDVGHALVYCIDAPGPTPVHGRFIDIQGDNVTAWTKNGRWGGSNLEKPSHQLDLTILHRI